MSKINKVNFDGAYLRSSSGHFFLGGHYHGQGICMDYNQILSNHEDSFLSFALISSFDSHFYWEH